MPYDHTLADRIRKLLAGEPTVAEKQMFGGLAFLIDGKLAVAANRSGALMVRVDPHDLDALIDDTHVHPVIMRNRPTKGWLSVDAVAIESEQQLREWVARGVTRAAAWTNCTAQGRWLNLCDDTI